MKRRALDLQRKGIPLEKQVLKNVPSHVPEVDVGRVRFTANDLRSQRKRLELSAADCGKLTNVADQAIYNREHETTKPRKQQLAIIASIRGLGKPCLVLSR